METREKIAAIRRYKNINQTTAAKAIGVSLTTYCARENGNSLFFAKDLEALSRLLDTPVSDLMGESC